MKKTLIAISAAYFGALSVLAADAVTDTSYSGLKFGTNEWFSVTATAGGSAVAGGTLEVGTGDTFSADGFSATDPAHPITFTSTNATADTTFRTVTIVTRASTVPTGMDMAGADKIAVSLREVGSETNFYAKIGTDWVKLTGGAVPAEGTEYALVIRFDDRNTGKKVQFATVIDSTESVLKSTDVTDGWFDYGALTGIQPNQVHVGLLGKGLQTGFDGVVLNIVAEIIPAGGDGAIEIKEEDKEAFDAAIEGTSYTTVSEYLQAPVSVALNTKATRAASGVTVAQAYALGLVKTENGAVVAVNDGALEAKAGAIVTGADAGIKVGFIGITPRPETVDKIEYELLGSTDGTDWTKATKIDTFESVEAIKIPASCLSTLHFFKVNAKVSLKPIQQQ